MRCLYIFFSILCAACGVGAEEFSYSDATSPDLQVKAEAGDADAQYWLGYRYYSGSDTLAQDSGLAVKWLQRAVDQHQGDAQSLLGYMYCAASGVAPDAEKGLALMQDAVAQTNRVAQYYMGSFIIRVERACR